MMSFSTVIPCRVSEDIDDVLQIVKEVGTKSKKTKPPPREGQRSSSKAASGGLGLFDSDSNAGGASEMGTDDIMKYIQQNQAGADDDDLDLF